MNIKRNFFQNLALAGLAAIATYLPAGEPKPEQPLAEIVPLEARAEEEPRKGEFLQPTLEHILDQKTFTLESHGSGENGAIIIPFIHPQFNALSARENNLAIAIMKENKDLVLKINRAGIAKDIVMEGINVDMANAYNRGGTVDLRNLHNKKTEFHSAYSSWLNNCKWNLIGIPYETTMRTNLHTVKIEAELKVRDALKAWQEKGWLESKAAFETHGDKALKELSEIVSQYAKEVIAYYEKDPRGKALYQSVVIDQHQRILSPARAALKSRRVVICCGTGHEQGLREELEKENIPYKIARNKKMGQYKKLPEEYLMEELRKQTLAFIEPIPIKIKGLGEIGITPGLEDQPFYKAYISPGQKQ